VISDEVVEAAARDVALSLGIPWEELSEKVKDLTRARVRKILTIAAPHLMAQAWDEGNIAGIFDLPSEDHATPNPYRSGT